MTISKAARQRALAKRFVSSFARVLTIAALAKRLIAATSAGCLRAFPHAPRLRWASRELRALYLFPLIIASLNTRPSARGILTPTIWASVGARSAGDAAPE